MSNSMNVMPGTSIVAAVGGIGYSDGTATARGESGMVTMSDFTRKRAAAKSYESVELVNEVAVTTDLAVVEDDVEIEQEEAVFSKADSKPKEQPYIRTNLSTLAFFEPTLRTDKDGTVSYSFTAPDLLTQWNVKGLAWTQELATGQLERQLITRKELMIQPNMPRFLREGDTATLMAKVMNLTDSDLTVKVDFSFEIPNASNVSGDKPSQFSILNSQFSTFLYRDFQSRNVMIKDGQPYFIDFQGGRKGPTQYDVASFLWQAKANFSPELREHLIDAYLDELEKMCKIVNCQLSIVNWKAALPHFVLFRTLQVLGAYGYRGYFERKPHFLESIPLALKNLREILAGLEDYPYLKELAESLPINSDKFGLNRMVSENLTVTIYSFSFKRGIPTDDSGNGGGYVFDCRSTHNPGKYEQYKSLTGLDQPVIDFLEQDGEILTFLNSVYALVDHHVERFIERDFTNLQVSFGCTGGQHRSVYCAEHLAQHLHEKYGVRIHLIHREQNQTRILEP